MSEKNHNFGDLVCIYAQLLPKIKESAKGLGYALAIHGSMNRDLDILAAPWIEDAAPPEALVAAIAEAVDGFVIGAKDGQFERGKLDPVPHKFPHGRMCWNICWGGRPFIDLSIMPRITKGTS
jgi:hypothetical protein